MRGDRSRDAVAPPCPRAPRAAAALRPNRSGPSTARPIRRPAGERQSSRASVWPTAMRPSAFSTNTRIGKLPVCGSTIRPIEATLPLNAAAARRRSAAVGGRLAAAAHRRSSRGVGRPVGCSGGRLRSSAVAGSAVAGCGRRAPDLQPHGLAHADSGRRLAAATRPRR